MAISQDILGGIRIATERGETLKDAMITFLNAGYTKKDIEDSARVFQYEQYRKQLRQQGMSAPPGQSLIRRAQQPPMTIQPKKTRVQKLPRTPQPTQPSKIDIRRAQQPPKDLRQQPQIPKSNTVQEKSNHEEQYTQPPLPPHLQQMQQEPMQRQMIQRVSSYGEQSSQPPLPPQTRQIQRPDVKQTNQLEVKQTQQQRPKQEISLRTKQKVSSYGEPESVEEVKKKIKTAIEQLEEIKVPKELEEKASSEDVKEVGAKDFFHRK